MIMKNVISKDSKSENLDQDIENKSSELTPNVTNIILNEDIELIEFHSLSESLKEITIYPKNKFVFVINLRDRIHVVGEDKSVSLPIFYHILTKSTSKRIKIIFPNKEHQGCVLLCSKEYIERVMKDTDSSFAIEHFFNEEARIARPNLALCDRVGEIRNLNTIYHDKMIALGYAHITLGIAIKQAIETKNGTYSHSSSLSNREIRSVRDLITEIKNNPSYDYSVDYLAKKAAISVPKLQTGFKEICKMTVANFVRDVRLQKSEELLKSSDMNVSQIVYSIGFSSRSYFSRIFKGKYHCSPSDYQRQCQLG